MALVRIRTSCPASSAASAMPIISGFMKDEEIGLKRLMSMPDRFTNTVNTADKGTVCRPTVINLFEQPLESLESWWGQWKAFMFEPELSLPGGRSMLPASMLGKIKRAKYPALTEQEETRTAEGQAAAKFAYFQTVNRRLVREVQTFQSGAHAQLQRHHSAGLSFAFIAFYS